MDPLLVDALTIETQLQDTPPMVRLKWRGRTRDRQPGKTIAPYLTTAVGWAAERMLPLEMRFEELEYFNSATVMVIIRSIHEARAKSVRLRIVYDDRLEWQRLSFEPMFVLAEGDKLELCATSSAAVSAT